MFAGGNNRYGPRLAKYDLGPEGGYPLPGHETCGGCTPTGTDAKWWPPKHARLTSGWYSSYWNAFLFNVFTLSVYQFWALFRLAVITGSLGFMRPNVEAEIWVLC